MIKRVMQKRKWLLGLTALMAVALLSWAGFGYPQTPGPASQSASEQVYGQGRGPGDPACPHYPAYRSRGQGQTGARKFRGGKRGQGKKGQAGYRACLQGTDPGKVSK